MTTHPVSMPATTTEADRLLARRQAVLARSQALWSRANALEEGTEPPKDDNTAQDEDYDHGDAQKARWHAEDYDEETAGELDALLGHIERTGQIPTAWRAPLPDSATDDEVTQYTANLAVPEGGHVVTQQFTVTMWRFQDRWVPAPSSLYGDALDVASEPVHAHDCPCGQRVDDTSIDTALDETSDAPAPTPGQLADSFRRAYEIAATPAG